MNWSDETLMAFADGELDDPRQRADLEAALAADPALRQRVAAMKAQRDRVAAAFSGVLDEPMPDRLSALLRPAGAAPVASLDAARAAREARRRMPTWAQWGGMAASVALGVVLGMQIDRGAADTAIGLREGRLVAQGAIEQALAAQLAGAPQASAPVAVQLSFVDKDGSYCRTFSTAAVAGLACRQGGHWTVQALAGREAAADPAMRQAATALPRAVLDAVDQRIGAGKALDAAEERQARDRGWRR